MNNGKVVIFHKEGIDILKDAVFYDRVEELCVVNPSEKIITLGLILKTILFSFSGFEDIVQSRPLIRKLGLRIYIAYLKARVLSCNPICVVTFNDNSKTFQLVAKNSGEVNFYAIQNGNRSKIEMKGLKNHLTNFMCFGEFEADDYKRLGHSAERFIPIGSLVAGLYLKEKKDIQRKYDFCFVSQWKKSIFENGVLPEAKAALAKFDEYFARFLDEKGYKAAILRRYADDVPEEKAYFESIYGDLVEYVDFVPRVSSYVGMDESEVVLTLYSTTAREAFGWGKKVIFCDYSNSDNFNGYDPGIWLLKDLDYTVFCRHLIEVLEMDKIEYREKTFKYSQYLMRTDESGAGELVRRVIFG